MCRLEGEVRFTFLGALQVLKFLKAQRMINRYGYICRQGVPVSQDDIPHYRTRGKKLTIPDCEYPDEFYELLMNTKWSGWLIASWPDLEEMKLIIANPIRTQYTINTRRVWEWIIENKKYVLHRDIESQVYTPQAGADLGHNLAKMIIIQLLVPQVEDEQTTQEIKNRRELSKQLQELLKQ